MSLLSLRISPSDKTEIVISVSKRVSKSAVVRNTVKRRIRPILKKLPLKTAKYLFVTRPGVENLKGKELENELKLLIAGRKL